MIITDIKELRYVGKDDGQTVGVTSGCFDLMHFYHIHYLKRCKALCDVLFVGVDADSLVIKNKGRSPAVPEYQRVQSIAELRCVDVVFTLRSLDDLKLATKHADKLFKHAPTIYGGDIVGAEDCELIIVPDVDEARSSTELKQKIRGENTGQPNQVALAGPSINDGTFDQ